MTPEQLDELVRWLRVKASRYPPEHDTSVRLCEAADTIDDLSEVLTHADEDPSR